MKRSWRLSIFLLICFACSRPLPTLDGVDLAAWKDDHQGCLGKRVQFTESIRAQRDKLKALSEVEIVNLLGRPDRNDLSERNQKFYIFFIEGGPGCSNSNGEGLKLIIRFNATGVSREIAIE